VYSTCSLEQEENEEQVAWFGKEFAGWVVAARHLTLPERERDGGFIALCQPT
jgi:16S rRNA C967 or C1407 C5-methylase (RsmB/RsmF family)